MAIYLEDNTIRPPPHTILKNNSKHTEEKYENIFLIKLKENLGDYMQYTEFGDNKRDRIAEAKSTKRHIYIHNKNTNS